MAASGSCDAPGSIAAVATVYQSPLDGDGVWTWSESDSNRGHPAAPGEDTSTFALVARCVRRDDVNRSRTHSITIQSPWLQAALQEHVFRDYPDVTSTAGTMEFKVPFKPFLHRWGDLLALARGSEDAVDGTARTHAALLYDLLKVEAGDAVETLRGYISSRTITFERLWMIYQPGITVVSSYYGRRRVFELCKAEYHEADGKPSMQLQCEYIDWGGSSFGRATVNFGIPSFRGTRDIASLEAYPLEPLDVLLQRGDTYVFEVEGDEGGRPSATSFRGEGGDMGLNLSSLRTPQSGLCVCCIVYFPECCNMYFKFLTMGYSMFCKNKCL
ncbi:hypothetical protein F5883DRAFT_566527 [Diaporthe sp. PMI_573]|nr:hypothetical protein F5883DRAFT_566527 [Diaporthaceae sp. PMI_573]